ncbi:MAG TPA: pyridoxamine 5'-phosphate oxidase family protein [Amycolatopsis sp.]|nr:pyridoxamine 5'-phosphate oxidase family protein [Amycolatopsis sp.]
MTDAMIDAFGLEVLDRDECITLLGTAEIGRVVFTTRGLPAVEPVKYQVRGDSVWFAVEARTELFGSAHDGVVAFEVDAFDATLRTGWWVTVLGRATVAPECDLPRPPKLSWQPPLAGDVRCVRIPIEVVSGRRVA